MSDLPAEVEVGTEEMTDAVLAELYRSRWVGIPTWSWLAPAMQPGSAVRRLQP